MAESAFFKEHEKYEYLQFVIPDINSIPRGKVTTGKMKEKVGRHGFETGNAICLYGPNCEIPTAASRVFGKHFPNDVMRPCLETLTPWPWVGKEGRRVGNVLCDLVTNDGTPNLMSPRQLMKTQLDALWEQHGLVFKSAFEYEFSVFKKDCLEPLGGNYHNCWDIRTWGEHHELFGDLMDILSAMGVQVEFLTPEFGAGQWELTTEPQVGFRGGDVAFYVKNAVMGFFQTRGYHATFMTKPLVEEMCSGLHLNHSLWSKEGEEGEDDHQLKSVMLDPTDSNLLSPTARHWLAGVLTHAPALTALACPTLNCYRRLFNPFTPTHVNWGLDNRFALIRAHTRRNNGFLENRLPSGACNPYLAIAGTVAAGLDGLNRKLSCPEPTDSCEPLAESCPERGSGLDPQGGLPKTLAEALSVLEKDEHLRALLGDVFVESYVESKRGYEVAAFDPKVCTTPENQLHFERGMYLKNL